MIAIPKEVKVGEERIALTPTEVAKLCNAGLEVLIEKSAGTLAGFSDEEYTLAGAKLANSAQELFEQGNIIVKVKEPQAQELELLRPEHQLFCYLHLGGNQKLAEDLQQIGLTAYAYETLQVNGKTPLLAPMSAIAGRLSIQMGSHLLHAHQGGRGVLLGGFSGHSQGVVTIIGAGIAGTEAAILASGMGADVRVMDLNPQRLADLQNKLPKIAIHESNPSILNQWLEDTDLLVGAVYVLGKTAPKVIAEEQIKIMPKGSVAFDIAIDQGGCIATSRPCTHFNPAFGLHGVLHSAITNLPAAVPHSASKALAQAIFPYVMDLGMGRPDSLASALNIQRSKLLIDL